MRYLIFNTKNTTNNTIRAVISILCIFIAYFVHMESLLINTTPQQINLYSIKKHEGEAFPLPFHMHERYELTYIIKGQGTRIIGDNVKQYEDGDIVLMAPFTSHHWQSNLSAASAITIFFSKEFPSKDFQKLPEFQVISQLLETAKYGIELKGKVRQSIATQIAQLTNEYSLQQIIRFLSLLNEIGTSGEYNILMDKGFTISKKQDRERITNIVNHISTNITRKITIKELATIACMHEGSITRFFKQSTGFALVEYINLMRIGLACQILSGTNKTILDVSFECGFPNLSHFNRYFKRIKNCTPSEYRKNFQ